MLACLTLQAAFVTICLRRYVPTRLSDFLLLSMVMLLMLAANSVQIGLWAAVFVALGEFRIFRPRPWIS